MDQRTRNFGSAELRSSLFFCMSQLTVQYDLLWKHRRQKSLAVLIRDHIVPPYRSCQRYITHTPADRGEMCSPLLARVLFIALQMNHERFFNAFPPTDQLLYLCLSSHVLSWQLSARSRLASDSPSCQRTRRFAGAAASCLPSDVRLPFSVCERVPERLT